MKTVLFGLMIVCSVGSAVPRTNAAPPATKGVKPPPSKSVTNAPPVRVTFPVGHPTNVNSAAFSPDGRLVATAAQNEIILWERATGNEIARLPKSTISGLVFGPDSKRLAVVCSAASAFWTITVFDVATRKELWDHGTGGEYGNLAFSPDGTRLAVGSYQLGQKRGRVVGWNVATGEEAFDIDLNGKQVTALDWMPNGTQMVAGCSGGDVLLCDAASGQAARTLFNTGTNSTAYVDIHPDGRRILVGTEFRNKSKQPVSPVRVWDVDGKPLQDFPVNYQPSYDDEAAQCVRWAENGKAVVAEFHNRTPVHVWEANGTLRRTHPFSLSFTEAFGVSADGAFAVFPAGRGAAVVRLSGGDEQLFTGRKLPVTTVAYSKDGKWGLIGAQNGEARLIEMGTGRNVRRFPDIVDGQSITTVSLSADGARACAATYASNPKRGLVVVWETATGKTLLRWETPDGWDFANAVLSSNGKTVVGGNQRGEVRGWDVDGGRVLFGPIKKQSDTIYGPAFRPDSQAFAVAVDKNVLILDAQTGQTLKTLTLPNDTSAYLGFVDWSADGKYVVYVTTPSQYTDQSFYLFDAQTGVSKGWYDPSAGSSAQEKAGYIKGGGVRGFAPNAVVSNGFKVMGAGSKTPLPFDATSDRPSEWARGTAFSPDGKFQRVLTGNGGVALYDVKRGKAAVTLLSIAGADSNPGGEWIAYDESGRFTGSEAAMQTVAVVTGPIGSETTLPISRFFERYYAPNLVAATLGQSAGGTTQTPVAPLAPLPSPTEALKNGAPPLVRLLVPASVTASTVEVIVEATEQAKGGVKAVRLYHNGKLIGGPSVLRGIGIEAVSGAVTTKKFTVALESGANEFRAVAYSNTDVESKAASATVTFVLASVAKPTLHVLAVGINTYKDAQMNLAYARPDAESLADLFDVDKGSKAGGLFSQTKITRLFDQNATGAAILAGVNSLAQTAKPEDVVLVYLAGHGEMADGVWHFLPAEMRQMALMERVKEFGIAWPKIEAAVGKIRARKVVLVVDACKSGGALSGIRGGTGEEQALAVMARAQGIHILMASTSQQYAGEVKALGHGILTYALLEGLSGKAITEQTPAVMVRELMSYVENRVPELSLKYRGEAQYPVPFNRGQNFPVATKQ